VKVDSRSASVPIISHASLGDAENALERVRREERADRFLPAQRCGSAKVSAGFAAGRQAADTYVGLRRPMNKRLACCRPLRTSI
jgi:hypothetical protein